MCQHVVPSVLASALESTAASAFATQAGRPSLPMPAT
jgi:hypothetical protein